MLDFELAGYGDRDADVAWALFLRPGQRFMNTPEEENLFLQGYSEVAPCDPRAVKYHMAQYYAYFLEFSGRDEAYNRYVRQWLQRNCIP